MWQRQTPALLWGCKGWGSAKKEPTWLPGIHWEEEVVLWDEQKKNRRRINERRVSMADVINYCILKYLFTEMNSVRRSDGN